MLLGSMHRRSGNQAPRKEKIISIFKIWRNNILCCLAGITIGVVAENIFLTVVLGVCFSFLPVYYNEFKNLRVRKNLNNTLHFHLNIITTAYLQSENITEAVKTSLSRLQGPVKEVMQQFVMEADYVDTNIAGCIGRMKDRLDNRFFQEWCNALIQCQYDRDLKFVLMFIIEKMADVRKIQDELDTQMIMVYRDFFSVAVVALTSYPMLRFLNKDWFTLMSATIPGKIIVSVTYLVLFAACVYAVKVNKPVTFK